MKMYRATCDCGFDRLSSTEPLARRSLRAHSCDKQQRRAAAQARGEARRAAVDRTPKPCLHKQAKHQHGDYAAYVLDHCRCEPCTKANSEYEKHRSRQAAYGRWQPYVPAGAARLHVLMLMKAGMGLKRVARVSGVPHGALSKLVYGKRQADGTYRQSAKIRKGTADALLAVTATVDTMADGAKVDGTGTNRRLRALVAMGWSQSQLARRLDVLPSNFTPLIDGKRDTTASTARRVRDLYERLADTAPPESTHRERIAASRARNYAAERKWLSPAWWDDDLIDDPTHDPNSPLDLEPVVDEVLIERALEGEDVNHLMTRDDRLETVLRLHDRGLSPYEISKHLHGHITGERIRQILAQHRKDAA